MKLEYDIISLVSFVIHHPNRSERRISIAVHPAPIILVNAHNTESEAPHFDIPPHQISIMAWQEFFGLLLTQHDRFAPSVHIDLVDISPIKHFLLIDDGFIGIYARERGLHAVVVETDHHAIFRNHRSHSIDMGLKITPRLSNIRIIKRNISSLFQSVISLRRIARTYHHRVGQELSHMRKLCIDQSVARPQQEDQHKDAPRHGKSRECSTQLIALDRRPDFS